MDLANVDEFVPAPGATWRPSDAYLAGGTWLFSAPQPGVGRLLDLRAYDWPSITETAHGVDVAATCTFAELVAWPGGPPTVRKCCDALMGSFKIWNEATVGGNLCLALPAGPMTALCAAYDGTCEIWMRDGGRRRVAAIDFVTGPGQMVLAPGELLRSIHLPAAALGAATALRQASLSRYGRSAALVIGRRDDDAVVLTITAATPRPVQVRVPHGADAAQLVAAAVAEWFDDVHGDPRWRAATAAQLAVEVVTEVAAA
jgi:CO/xanthine dehydrogenase FAD-binding subunit